MPEKFCIRNEEHDEHLDTDYMSEREGAHHDISFKDCREVA